MRSHLLEGEVYHRRETPTVHGFRRGLGLVCLDLAELPILFRGRFFWGVERARLLNFRRKDCLGRPCAPWAKPYATKCRCNAVFARAERSKS
ncbi:MAG: DUF1365 family protein [Planctomycetota bacterium]